MEDRSYLINKGINKAIEFKGLKSQYIWYVIGVLIGSMLLYAVLYISGITGYIGLPLAFGAGAFGVNGVFRLSKRYGQYGLMKQRARKAVPRALVSRSRKCFIQLFSKYAGTTR